MKEVLHAVSAYGGFGLGLLSAYLWWKASTIVIRMGHPKSIGVVHAGANVPVDQAVDAVATALEQSRWNKQAALATAAAILLQATVPLYSN
jgi:hypothetical protein